MDLHEQYPLCSQISRITRDNVISSLYRRICTWRGSPLFCNTKKLPTHELRPRFAVLARRVWFEIGKNGDDHLQLQSTCAHCTFRLFAYLFDLPNRAFPFVFVSPCLALPNCALPSCRAIPPITCSTLRFRCLLLCPARPSRSCHLPDRYGRTFHIGCRCPGSARAS